LAVSSASKQVALPLLEHTKYLAVGTQETAKLLAVALAVQELWQVEPQIASRFHSQTRVL